MTAKPSHDLSVDVSYQGGATVARIAGTVDSLSADALLATLRSELANGNRRLVGDLSGVQYTSSTGLRALLGAVKAARRSGGDLRLAGARTSVRKVLEMSGFTTVFQLYADVDAAVASYDA